MGNGNENLYKWGRLFDQDGRMPIYGKNLFKNDLQNQLTHGLET